VPLSQLKTITLLHEELEALRLVDLEEHYQEQALMEGAALQIEGGTFRVATRYWECNDCGHCREIEHGSGQSKLIHCPVCGSHAIRLRRTRRHQQGPKEQNGP
jgi:Zn finger protein HypA/HybF involved in hydrogenase expression